MRNGRGADEMRTRYGPGADEERTGSGRGKTEQIPSSSHYWAEAGTSDRNEVPERPRFAERGLGTGAGPRSGIETETASRSGDSEPAPGPTSGIETETASRSGDSFRSPWSPDSFDPIPQQGWNPASKGTAAASPRAPVRFAPGSQFLPDTRGVPFSSALAKVQSCSRPILHSLELLGFPRISDRSSFKPNPNNSGYSGSQVLLSGSNPNNSGYSGSQALLSGSNPNNSGYSGSQVLLSGSNPNNSGYSGSQALLSGCNRYACLPE